MAHFLLRLISCVWFGSISGGLLFAQSTDALRTFEFKVFTNTLIKETVVYQETPGTIRPIEFKRYQRSSAYKYTGTDQITFAKQIRAGEGELPPEYQVISRLGVPESIRQPLFLFFADPSTESGLVVDVMEDADDTFPPGTLLIFNKSGHRLQGTINGTAADIPHDGKFMKRLANTASVQLALMHNGKFLRSFDQKVVFEARERTVLLLLPPQRKTSPLVRWVILTDKVESE